MDERVRAAPRWFRKALPYVTFREMVFPEMSHLDDSTFARLSLLISGVEDDLQSRGYRVGKAMKLDPAFNARSVESPLCRAIIAQSFCSLEVKGLLTKLKPNCGAEAIVVSEGVERRFRLRSARKDRYESLIVRSNTDSILTSKGKNDPTLFEDEVDEIGPSENYEQWVIAHLLNPGTHTFHEVWIGEVVGLIGKAPFRLRLADVVRLPHDAPLPPAFRPKRDDLDLGDESENRGEEAG